MIDFNFFLKNPDIWVKQSQKRWINLDFNEIIELNWQKNIIKSKLNKLIWEKKQLSNKIAQTAKISANLSFETAEAKKVKEEIFKTQINLNSINSKLEEFISQIPNLLDESVLSVDDKVQKFEDFSWNKLVLDKFETKNNFLIFLLEFFFKKGFKLIISDDMEDFAKNNLDSCDFTYKISNVKNGLLFTNLDLKPDLTPLRFAVLKKNSFKILSILKSTNSYKEQKLFCEFFEEILEIFLIVGFHQVCNAEETHIFENKRYNILTDFDWKTYKIAHSSNYWDFLARKYNLKFLEWREKYFPHIIEWVFHLHF